MSDRGNDQPLAPRRSLSPAQTSVDGPTPPMGVPAAYAGDADPRHAPAQLPPQPTGHAAAPSSGSTSYPPATAVSSGSASYPHSAAPQPRPARPQPGASPAPTSRPRGVRRARLRMTRIDPWSVTKAAFLLSIAFGIMCVVAVFLISSVMSAAGLWDSVNASIQGLVNQNPADAFDIKDYVGTRRVLGLTMLIAALDVVLITALATLGAFLYNMAASLLGGIEVTLAEDPTR